MADAAAKMKSFEQAKAELDEIMQEFDSEQVSMDELVPKLKRARELVEFCNKKIKEVESEVKDILKAIEPKAKEAEAEEGSTPF